MTDEKENGKFDDKLKNNELFGGIVDSVKKEML